MHTTTSVHTAITHMAVGSAVLCHVVQKLSISKQRPRPHTHLSPSTSPSHCLSQRLTAVRTHMHWRCYMRCTTVCMHVQPKKKYQPSHIHRKPKTVDCRSPWPGMIYATGGASLTWCAAPMRQAVLPVTHAVPGWSDPKLKLGRSAAGSAAPQDNTAPQHRPLDDAAAIS
jgi:hypothetical protein